MADDAVHEAERANRLACSLRARERGPVEQQQRAADQSARDAREREDLVDVGVRAAAHGDTDARRLPSGLPVTGTTMFL